MFLFQPTVQVQIEYKISGMSSGAEFPSSLGGFVKWTLVRVSGVVIRTGYRDQSMNYKNKKRGYARQGIGANSIFL